MKSQKNTFGKDSNLLSLHWTKQQQKRRGDLILKKSRNNIPLVRRIVPKLIVENGFEFSSFEERQIILSNSVNSKSCISKPTFFT